MIRRIGRRVSHYCVIGAASTAQRAASHPMGMSPHGGPPPARSSGSIRGTHSRWWTGVPEFSELDALMERFRVDRCVIDGLPETHPTRAFSARYAGKAYLCFFNESQRGQARWDREGRIVQFNRTEALDASRAIVREKHLVLPSRQETLIEEFARHMAADAKVLDEDEETGMRRHRYIRTGADHFSLAFTYALLGASDDGNWRGFFRSLRRDLRERGIQA